MSTVVRVQRMLRLCYLTVQDHNGKGGVSGMLPRDPISVDSQPILKNSRDGYFSPAGQNRHWYKDSSEREQHG